LDFKSKINISLVTNTETQCNISDIDKGRVVSYLRQQERLQQYWVFAVFPHHVSWEGPRLPPEGHPYCSGG
jgi:hypothetical protein